MITQEQVIDPDVRSWLDTRYPDSQATAQVSLIIWNKYYEWLQTDGDPRLRGKSPGELADLQETLNKASNRRERQNQYIILNSILEFIRQRTNTRTGYNLKCYSSISSFFTQWGCELPKLEKGMLHTFKGKQKVQKKLTNEVLKSVVYASDPCHRAVYSIMALSGLGLGEVTKWSDSNDLGERITVDGVNLVEVVLGARKTNVEGEFKILFGGSALKYYDQWLQVRPGDARAIFVSTHNEPVNAKSLTRYWHDQLVLLGKYQVDPDSSTGARSGLNAHLIRGIFRTNWATSGARPEIAEYQLGHAIDKLGYNLYAENRLTRIRQYLKALPTLDVWVEREADQELNTLKDRVAVLEKLLVKVLQRSTGEDSLTPEEKAALEEESRKLSGTT